MKIVEYAMKLAPLGVFAIIFQTLFRSGAGVLWALGLYEAEGPPQVLARLDVAAGRDQDLRHARAAPPA